MINVFQSCLYDKKEKKARDLRELSRDREQVLITIKNCVSCEEFGKVGNTATISLKRLFTLQIKRIAFLQKHTFYRTLLFT